MLKLSRAAVAAVLFAGAGLAVAQPPGPGGPGGRPGFEKKDGGFRKVGDRDGERKKDDERKDAERRDERRDGDRRDAERKDGPRPPAEALERELQMLRARIAEVEGQLKRSRDGDRRPEEPKRDGPRGFGSDTARGPGPGGPGFPFDRGGPGPFGGPPMGFGGPGGGFGGPGPNTIERMSAEQIKEMIGRLQRALEAKTRGDQPKKPEKKPEGDQPKKPGDKTKKPDDDRGNPSNADVMKRLEQINKELEQIRRSLGK